MRKFREYKTIAYILLILFLVFCAFWNWKINSKSLNTVAGLSAKPLELQKSGVENGSGPQTQTPKNKIVEKKNDINVNFKISTENFSLSVPENSSVLEALVLAQQEKLTTFSGKEYPALGFFVSDSGSLHSGDSNYLIYYINEQEASVGVSSYELKDGDTIEWKLE